MSQHSVTFVLTIVSPHQDIARAEDQLDDLVDELLFAIDQFNNIGWTSAEKVDFDDSHIAYDVNLRVISESQKAV